MKKYLVISLVALVVCLSGALNGFCQYYELDGKWVKINGPVDWEVLGIALDQSTCDVMIAVVKYRDQDYFSNFLKNYDVFRIPNGSSALVLDVEFYEGRAKVMVFRTLYERESGWIPLSWLDGNQHRPQIKDVTGEKNIFRIVRNF